MRWVDWKTPTWSKPRRTATIPVAADSDESVDARALADARPPGLTAVNVTLGYVAGPMEPFEHTIREIGRWDRILRRHPGDLIKVYTAADILQARAEHGSA